MSCTAPESYYKADPALNAGVAGLVKSASKALRLIGGEPIIITVNCGKCIDCRLAHSREWGLRCMHEDQLSAGPGSFVTLTYNDEHLPEDWSLRYRDYQLFMHKLRKAISGAGRFFMCGEYGEDNGRPHYHSILFNCEFVDRVFYKRIGEIDYYTSVTLSRLWGNGFCLIGDVTLESASYVARYSLKKITGAAAGAAYQWIVPGTGEIVDRMPPFSRSSNRPGIGFNWFMRYYSDCFPCDFMVWKGARFPVPRYYTKLYERMTAEPGASFFHQSKADLVLAKRAASMEDRKNHPDFTPRRLLDKQIIAELNSTNERKLR